MRLSRIIRNTGIWPVRYIDVDVSGLYEDSRDVANGGMFFCVKGYKSDGHDFVADAFKRGAHVIVVSDKSKLRDVFSLGTDVVVLFSDDIRRDLALASVSFFGAPHRKIKLVGITGTNGKTSVSYILFNLLKRIGEFPGLIGTVKYACGDLWEIEADRTTPSPIKFNYLLSRMFEDGARWVICEVSSHALELKRMYGVRFSSGAFTNLSHEHLDFHGSMENYFLSKYGFADYADDFFVVNIDDPWGKFMYTFRSLFNVNFIPCGVDADFALSAFEDVPDGSVVFIRYRDRVYRVSTSLKCRFNAYNILMAFSILCSYGFDPSFLSSLRWDFYIPGRMEEVAEGVFVDYAHTPDALRNALSSLKNLSGRGRLIVVFGCGGERDKKKRPAMGRIAEGFADVVIVTSDNPRCEPVGSIIDDILSGISNAEKVLVIPDRYNAIKHALSMKDPSDVVLIAGKGHELYQEVGGVRYRFSDREAVERVLSEN